MCKGFELSKMDQDEGAFQETRAETKKALAELKRHKRFVNVPWPTVRTTTPQEAVRTSHLHRPWSPN